MGQMEQAKAPKALLSELDAGDAETRWQAATNLAQVRTPEAVQALAKTLRDPEPFVRWAGAHALGEIARQAGDSPVLVAAGQAVLEAAEATDAGARAAAADAVAAWGPQGPLEPLLLLVYDADASVRTAAVRALGLAGGQSPQIVVPPLLRALDDPDLEVRRMAINALAWCRDEACTLALRARLADPAGVVRAAALRALGRLGDGEGASSALALLRDPDPAVRVEAIRLLRRQGGADSLTGLRELEDDATQFGDATVGELAREASWQVERRHVPWLKRLLRRRRRGRRPGVAT
jgi:HEAT repeat protein